MNPPESERATQLELLERVFQYHEQTKHRFEGYARSPGHLDWPNQPDPFRRYEGAPLALLQHPPFEEASRWGFDDVLDQGVRSPRQVNRRSLSCLFYHSLALSAWKRSGTSAWSLRVNPSSGNLHPTEAYLLCGQKAGLSPAAGIYHYSVYHHALESRLELSDEAWEGLVNHLPRDSILLGFTSIHWREAWKYGERAFRYCQHDVGHAVACATVACALLGWETRLIETLPDGQLSALLGVHAQEGPEAEHAECLLAISPQTARSGSEMLRLDFPTGLLKHLRTATWQGRPNRLSAEHRPWPIIETVTEATRHPGTTAQSSEEGSTAQAAMNASSNQMSGLPRYEHRTLAEVVRRRRSAVAMDGETSIAASVFHKLLLRTIPENNPSVFGALSWPPRICLVLFVHRVIGLKPGLYFLARTSDHVRRFRANSDPRFAWQPSSGCPDTLELFQLKLGDFRDPARTICCLQTIAGEGAFSLGMLASYDDVLRQAGPSCYRRLFWEAGAIGQALYLEAEAAGVRGTGIGCFFDDAMHQLLGIHDRSWQSLYHFTVGGPLDDPRLQTSSAYAHLEPKVVSG